MICTGDTTAYSMTWLMKEIHHENNRHLNAANRIRAEADELGFNKKYLTYSDAPVSHTLASSSLPGADNCSTKENAVCECNVG
jgi:hypothetical protein